MGVVRIIDLKSTHGGKNRKLPKYSIKLLDHGQTINARRGGG